MLVVAAVLAVVGCRGQEPPGEASRARREHAGEAARVHSGHADEAARADTFPDSAGAGSGGAGQLAPDSLAPAAGHPEEAPRGETGGVGSGPGDRRAPGRPDELSQAGRPEGQVLPESGLTVYRAYICKGVEHREPVEAGKSFISYGRKAWWLCCFTEVGGAQKPDTIAHVWYWGAREMSRVHLEVNGPRWRTWSAKRIQDEWRGEWHVDVLDSGGGRLTTLSFSVE